MPEALPVDHSSLLVAHLSQGSSVALAHEEPWPPLELPAGLLPLWTIAHVFGGASAARGASSTTAVVGIPALATLLIFCRARFQARSDAEPTLLASSMAQGEERSTRGG